MEENVKNKSAMPVASMVLGILSTVFSLFWYITIPCGVIAIVLGAKSAKRTGSKLGKTGVITGIIGLALCIFMYISIILIYIVENL